MEQLIINEYKMGDKNLLGANNIDEAMNILKCRRNSFGLSTKLQQKDDSTIVESVVGIDSNGFEKLIIAFQALQLGKIKDAKAFAEQLNKEYAECSEVYRLLSFIADQERDYKSAIKHIDDAIKYDNENTFAWLHKGRLLLYVYEKIGDAKECFKKCVEIDSLMFQSYYDLGLIEKQHYKELRPDKTEEQTDDLNKKLYEIHKRAFGYFQKAGAINRFFLDVYPNIAELHLLNNDFKDCIQFINDSFNFMKYYGLYNANNEKIIVKMKKQFEDAHLCLEIEKSKN